MRKIILGLLLLCLVFACSNDNAPMGSGDYASYPKEYENYQLPAYPNVAEIMKAESSPLGDDGDIQIQVQLKTTDDIGAIRSYYQRELINLGFQERANNQLEDLQNKGAPIDESNFYAGTFQNAGKVFNVTAMAQEQDTVSVNISFLGS